MLLWLNKNGRCKRSCFILVNFSEQYQSIRKWISTLNRAITTEKKLMNAVANINGLVNTAGLLKTKVWIMYPHTTSCSAEAQKILEKHKNIDYTINEKWNHEDTPACAEKRQVEQSLLLQSGCTLLQPQQISSILKGVTEIVYKSIMLPYQFSGVSNLLFMKYISIHNIQP